MIISKQKFFEKMMIILITSVILK